MSKGFSNRYTTGFALVVCLACSLVVALFAVGLKEKQQENLRLDRQVNVLAVAGLIEPGAKPAPEQVAELFERIETLLIDRASGAPIGEERRRELADAGLLEADGSLNLLKAAKHPGHSTPSRNLARLTALPDVLLIYRVEAQDGTTACWVLPIWGNGLWSTLYGFLSLEPGLDRVRGITYYQHGETPGLGGEVDNPRWKAQWPAKELFGPGGELLLEVTKAGKAADPDHQIDGISGATITSLAVDHMIELWLGEEGYGPFIRARAQGV